MKIDWKSREARTAIWVFVTVAAIIIFYRVIDDIDDLLGALRTGLGQAGTVLLPFVLGVFVTIPDNMAFAFPAGADYLSTVACGVTMGVTAITDPFFGMVAGIAVRLLGGLFGIL